MQAVNLRRPTNPCPVHNKRKPRGRDMADAAIRLRVYLGVELRRQAIEAGLDPEHYGSSAVTSLVCGLEKQGLRGIEAEAEYDVVE